MRNKLIRSVATPYAMMLDDDFLFSDDTRLEVLRDHLELHDELDLVAGMVLSRGGQLSHYEGLLEIEDDTLFYRHGTRGEVGGLPLYDLVYNFFVGRTARIRKVGWDNKQKLAEHSDFFLRAKGDLVVGYDETVSIGHQVAGSADYNRYRMRGTRYARQFLRKHNLARGIDFRGMVLEATE